MHFHTWESKIEFFRKIEKDHFFVDSTLSLFSVGIKILSDNLLSFFFDICVGAKTYLNLDFSFVANREFSIKRMLVGIRY